MANKTDLKREDQIGESYDDMFNNHPDLVQMEQDTTNREFDTIVANNAKFDAMANKNAGIDDVAAREKNTIPYIEPAKGGKVGNVLMRRRSPLMLLVALLGTGLFGASFFGPAGALIHVAEVLKDKYDTMSSVVDARGVLVLKNRMFETNASCKIKIRCKYSGITQRQMDRLEANGAKLVDANGKPVKKNALGRYTGGKKLVLKDGTEVGASQYKKSLRSNAELRSVTRSVFAPRWLSWNDEISVKVKESRRLVQNPKWEEESNGDDKDVGTRKSIHSAVSGEAAQIDSKSIAAEVDSNGNPTQSEADRLDFGEVTSQVNEEASVLSDAIANGDPITPLPSNTGEVALMKESLKKGFGTKLLELANPLSVVSGYCGTLQLTRALILASKTILMVQVMRYASQFMSTADKLKAGDATSAEVAAAMTILYTINKSGESFGDSTGYHYATYGTRSNAGIGSSATGNGVLRTLKTATIGWADRYFPGGSGAMNTTCKVATNTGVQVALSLTSFIPGGGQATKAFSAAVKGIAETAGKKFIKEVMDKITASITRDALKDATKRIGIEAGKAAGIFIGSYLIARYAVPALARIVAGAVLTGDEDGVTALDTIANGFEATNNQSALARGMQPLHKNELSAFIDYKDSNYSEYASDMMAEAHPFDTLNPYSFISQVTAGLYPQAIKAQSLSGAATLSSLASTISLSNIFSTPSVRATSNDNGCDDEYLNKQNLATSPFCNVTYGFADTHMLQNADPQDVANWMYNNGQVDDNGDPVTGSDFANFKATCVDVGEKIISDNDIGDENIVPKECYAKDLSTQSQVGEARLTDTKLAKAKWDSSKEFVKMYRLYLLDSSTDAGMDYEKPGNLELGGGSTFRVSSFNMRGASHTDGPGADDQRPNNNSADRIKFSANIISSKALDIVGTQEFEPSQAKNLYSLLPNYDHTTVGKSSDQIIWNSSKFSKQDEGTWQTTYFGGRIDEPWVLLRDNITQQNVYIMNVHDPINRGQGDAQSRYQNALNHIEQIKKLSKTAPVVLTGDFNSGYTPDAGSGAPSNEKLAYCVLTGSGYVTDTYDITNNITPGCPHDDRQPRDKLGQIDHIYVTKGLQAKEFQGVPGGYTSNGSDHPTVFVDVTIPGAETNGGSQLNVGTFNIYSSSDGTDYSVDFKPRLDQSATVIKSNNLDLVGLQEVRENQWSYLQQQGVLGDKFDVYPKNYKAAGYAANNPIIWNKSRYSLVEGATLPGYTPLNGRSNSAITQVVLRDIASNQQLVLINNHAPAHNGSAILDRESNAKLLQKYAQNASSGGTPVFVTGDFNSGYKPDQEQKTPGNDRNRMAYCILTEDNALWDAWDADIAKNKQGHCPSSDGPGVDHIFMSTNVTAKGYNNSNQPRGNGSDIHPAVFIEATIPRGGTGGGGSIGGDDYASECSKVLGAGAAECPGGRYAGECVSFVKFRLAKHGIKGLGTTGGGGGVTEALGRMGFKVDTTPAVNSVMSLRHTSVGHTAMVSKVFPDGSIQVEEYNWSKDHQYDTRKIDAATLNKYRSNDQLSFAHTETRYK